MDQIDHPNVVKLEAYDEDEKHIFMALEYMDGG